MIQSQGEQWKSIIEFPVYQISNFGNVRNIQKEKELKPIVQTTGYYQVTLYKQDFKQKKYIHRLVCQYFNSNLNNYQFVDHISWNKIDNRAENRRFRTQQQNNMNKKKHKNSSSNFKGVSFHQIARKWQARIKINGTETHLGLFVSEEDAGRCYDINAIQNFGEYAKTNFPLENYQQQNNQQ